MAKKKKQSKFNSLLGKLDPNTKLKQLVLFVVVFGVISGGYFLYKSHAATCYQTVWRYGSSGYCVSDIQGLLNYYNHSLDTSKYLSVDGVFGSKTKSEVQTVQLRNGLVVDGIVGSKTWPELCNPRKGPAPGWWLWYARSAGCPGA